MNELAIEECEEQLQDAQLSGDVAALDRLLDETLVFIALDGSVVGKADDLALHRSRRLRISKMEPSDRRILDFGDVAVVSVRMETEAVFDGVTARGPLRYTRVWTRGMARDCWPYELNFSHAPRSKLSFHRAKRCYAAIRVRIPLRRNRRGCASSQHDDAIHKLRTGS